MVKRSLTLLQRDANYSSSYAAAGQASCDCRTKPPTRRIWDDQGQEEESQCYSREKRVPQQLQRLLEQTPHMYHPSSHWLAKILVLVRGAGEPVQHTPFTEAKHWAAPSTML